MMTCIMLCKVAETLIQKHGFQGAEKLLKQNPLLWKEMIVKMQTPTMLAVFNVLADYQLDNALYFFRSRIEDAFSSRDYCGQMPYDRTHRGKNDSIFERLDTTFSFEQAQQQSISVKGANTTLEAVHKRLFWGRATKTAYLLRLNRMGRPSPGFPRMRNPSTCGFYFAKYCMVEGGRLNVVDRPISWRTNQAEVQKGLRSSYELRRPCLL